MSVRIVVTKLGPVVSEGSRLLWLSLHRRELTLTAASTALHCTRQLVGRWLRGEQRPGGVARASLFDHFGIQPNAWDRPPSRDFSLEAA